MQSVRARFAVVVLVLNLLTLSAGPALATQPHGCGATDHACCKGPKLAPCCSTDEDGGAPSSTPASPRVEIGGAAAVLLVLPWLAPDLAPAGPRDFSGSARSPATDLTTLLGSLRI